MKSTLAKVAELALVEAAQQLSPGERVEAFLAHSRLVTEPYRAGTKLRASEPQPQP